MADDVDVLLKFCEEQWAQCRQSEAQRATVTNFVITIAAAALAVMAHKGLGLSCLPLAVFLTILGLYGTLTSAKLYERWRFNRNRARGWYRRIDELRPEAHLMELRGASDAKHGDWLRRVRLNWLWVALHALITVVGLVCVVWTFKSAFSP